MAHAVAALPHASPDMFHGTAGRLRFNLLLWQETHEAEHLSMAVGAGEFLLKRSERLAGRHARWVIPPGYEDLSGDAYLGYAHGAAGIGDALLDLFLATGDDRFLEASQSAGRWLVGKAVRRSDNGLNSRPVDANADRPTGALWCTGRQASDDSSKSVLSEGLPRHLENRRGGGTNGVGGEPTSGTNSMPRTRWKYRIPARRVPGNTE